MNKKITSIILCLCMLLSCLAVGGFTSQAVTVDNSSAAAQAPASTGASTGPQATVDGSNILHCFNWSYNSIKSNLSAIKAAGYTAVQTSPVTPPKDYSASWNDQKGQWWKLYQPIAISVADGNTWLGTKNELKAMCQEADRLGIKVIVDIVANHMADVSGSGNNSGNIHNSVESTIKNNSSYWHFNDMWADNDNDRYRMTQGSIGQPDLNTGNSYIQQRFASLLKELVGYGVDGFRFDAAKHIELPTDSGCGSQFWPTVLNAAKSATSNPLFFYGEILNGAGTSIGNYTKYMSITDNYSGDCTLVAANSNNASGLANSNYSKGAGADKSVIWVESHDTYMGESGTAGLRNTSGVSSNAVVKAWAIVGSRANATSLFFARPAANMGAASSDTSWKSTAVAEVNKFKNYFAGQSEYLSSSGNVAYNERGTSGVVISKLDGAGSVTLRANKMANGTYKDQVSGGTFTVSGGQIKGNVGSSGVAVVYNTEPEGPSASVTPGSSSYKTDTLTLTLSYSNATSGQYSIDGGAFTSFTNGQKITIGSGVAYGATTKVSVKASNATKTSEVQTYTYTKVDPSAVDTIYYDNSSTNWSTVYAYFWDKNDQTVGKAWPGNAMSSIGNKIFEIEVPEGAANVIFNNGNDQTDDIVLQGSDKIYRNGSWQSYGQTPTQKPTVQPTTQQVTQQPTTQKVTQPTPIGSVLVGDVNNDKIISIADATEIQKHIAEITTLTGNNAVAADVDRDGVISIKDATCIQLYIIQSNTGKGYCGTYVNEQPATQPVTQPATQPITQPSGNYIYAKGWTYAYFWDNNDTTVGNAWPGSQMESIGNNIYRIEIPSGAKNVVFNNGNGGQTEDLSIPGAGMIYDNGWSTYSGGGQPATNPVGGNTVSFDNSSSNWGEVYAYFWGDEVDIGGAWPGTKMTNNGNIWTINIPSGATKVIFNNGNGAQTSDLEIKVNGTYSNNNWQ